MKDTTLHNSASDVGLRLKFSQESRCESWSRCESRWCGWFFCASLVSRNIILYYIILFYFTLRGEPHYCTTLLYHIAGNFRQENFSTTKIIEQCKIFVEFIFAFTWLNFPNLWNALHMWSTERLLSSHTCRWHSYVFNMLMYVRQLLEINWNTGVRAKQQEGAVCSGSRWSALRRGPRFPSLGAKQHLLPRQKKTAIQWKRTSMNG